MVKLTGSLNGRFQNRVGFDNVPSGEATKNNTPSLTLNVRHTGFYARRRSRCFMVGVDEHSYSDYAIQWLLDELVDDGDEVVCVRVVEKEIRNDQYQDDANRVMEDILAKNGANRAISFVLEYAVGKLHATFQRLVSHLFKPEQESQTDSVTDSIVPTSNAHCWHQRSLIGRHPGLGQLSEFLLQILSAVFTCASCRRAPNGAAHQKEGQACQRCEPSNISVYACRQ